MIFRTPHSTQPASQEPAPAWPVIERIQRQQFDNNVHLITQPAHAALSGEIAARLSPALFGALSGDVVRAISMHDSGWSADDARQVAALRGDAGGKPFRPSSFITVPEKESTTAWTVSIDTAAKLSPLGGYVVSGHFCRLAKRLPGPQHERFLQVEETRAKRLRAQLTTPQQELERMIDALQFCDVLSLYLCCGSQEHVVFPQNGGITLIRDGDRGTLRTGAPETPVFDIPQEFSFSVLHYTPGKRSAGGSAVSIRLT